MLASEVQSPTSPTSGKTNEDEGADAPVQGFKAKDFSPRERRPSLRATANSGLEKAGEVAQDRSPRSTGSEVETALETALGMDCGPWLGF